MYRLGDRRNGGRGSVDRRGGRRHIMEEDQGPKATFQELDAQMDDYAIAGTVAQDQTAQDDVS